MAIALVDHHRPLTRRSLCPRAVSVLAELGLVCRLAAGLVGVLVADDTADDSAHADVMAAVLELAEGEVAVGAGLVGPELEQGGMALGVEGGVFRVIYGERLGGGKGGCGGGGGGVGAVQVTTTSNPQHHFARTTTRLVALPQHGQKESSNQCGTSNILPSRADRGQSIIDRAGRVDFE